MKNMQSYCQYCFKCYFCFQQIPKSLLTAWKISVTEAEYLLANRQRNTESVLSVSFNGEERVPSPLPAEKPRKAPSFSVDSGRPPSPKLSPNGYEPLLTKSSGTLQASKGKACRKKKKCLSDIFGHIVSGSKESSVITKVVDQFHTTTCALKIPVPYVSK